jgi:hypothetical protein
MAGERAASVGLASRANSLIEDPDVLFGDFRPAQLAPRLIRDREGR